MPPVILFDGICIFCNRMINFVIRQDKQKHLTFGTLQSKAAQNLLQEHGLPHEEALKSFVFINGGKTYMHSTAALKVMQQLPWYWQWTQMFWVVPPFIRDGIYKWVSKNRYQWFGKKEDCMVPTPELRSRFIL